MQVVRDCETQMSNTSRYGHFKPFLQIDSPNRFTKNLTF
jgi:hypothetical protein